MNPGLIGGIAGVIIGLAGGIIGTAATIRNTLGPKEKAFTIKASFFVWIVGLLFLTLLLVLPTPWRFLLWIPYGIILPFGIIKWNKIQQKIREKETPNQ